MQQATHAAELLIQIVSDVRITTEAANQISLSTQQQTTASRQILLSLKEIANGIHQSSVSINQISSVTKNLIALGDKLNTQVNEIKVARI